MYTSKNKPFIDNRKAYNIRIAQFSIVTQKHGIEFVTWQVFTCSARRMRIYRTEPLGDTNPVCQMNVVNVPGPVSHIHRGLLSFHNLNPTHECAKYRNTRST